LSGEPGIDSDDLNDIIDTPAPPDIPPRTDPPPSQANTWDTDGVLVLNRIDTTQGKFHRNLIDMHITDNLESSSVLAVDAGGEGNGLRTTLGALVYWAFEARQSTFGGGGRNFSVRLEWRCPTSTGTTQAGILDAKSRGYIGEPNDTKNCEVTAIFRIRNIPNEGISHHDASIKSRGASHSDSNEKTLQVGGRMPYTTNERHNDLYGVEYTHPNYDYSNVTFVSPYTSSNYPQIPPNTWFGMKFVIYNVNNNQAVHAEMWVDTNPINANQDGYNNNWQKVWLYEHSGSKAPTWGGPNCQFRISMAEDVDIVAYNIHEIIPPTTNSTTATAIELAERAEFEESTGLRSPTWIEQMEVPAFESTVSSETQTTEVGLIQDSVDAVGNYLDVAEISQLLPEVQMKPVKKIVESEPKEEFYDDGDDVWEPV
jgi:hypothetical protein